MQFNTFCQMVINRFSDINSTLWELTQIDTCPFPREKLRTLDDVGRCHSALGDIVEEINWTYGPKTMGLFIVCLLSIMPHLFQVGIGFILSTLQFVAFTHFFWPFLFIYCIALLTIPAASVSKEAKKTTIILSEMLMKCTHGATEKEIVVCMERLNSRPIQLSLMGLTTLNNNLFGSSMVALIGYFFLVIQSYMTELDKVHSIGKT
ncbi:unnamed protein product [Bemisia tabaci]|uniref:Gustatory receptor n=2 Tax=Bemisia tabaci TaxID=7038 RepID=A0A9P0F0G1_BEMTA|nr:unnamed protein product [Bemisia tabaci]